MPTTTWVAWVTRMEPHFDDEWRTLGIFDASKPSTSKMNMNRELGMAALSFCCSATNAMVLPLDPIGPTVLDIMAILDTSPSSLLVDIALFGYEFDLDRKIFFYERVVEVLTKKDHVPSNEDMQKLHKYFFNYNTLINHVAGSEENKLKK